MSQQPIEVLLRPAVEINTTIVCGCAAVICLHSPWAFALAPSVGKGMAVAFALFGYYRYTQARRIWRYRRKMRRQPHFAVTSEQIPVSKRNLWLGKGFEWKAKHTQRLADTKLPYNEDYIEPTWAYKAARRLEQRFEETQWLVQLLCKDSVFNPLRPLPPVGGKATIHGVGEKEENVLLKLLERVGHMIVLGTTRVGKTRLAELLITQDIHRGEVTIVFDPKGDAELMTRMYIEAQKAGRGDQFYLFHLGWPDLSARYNPVGRFGRISEVSTRLAGQLSGEGNSAAFKEFAWRFINIISRARHALGQKPTYQMILSDVINIDALMIEYAKAKLLAYDPNAWKLIAQHVNTLNDKTMPPNMRGRDKLVAGIEMYLQTATFKDPVLEGIRSAVRYDKTYFDKIVASLLPLLEKLTSGRIAELLSPNYEDANDSRPLLNWEEVIDKKAIVYIGLDALTDFEVAQAVGNSMFADLVSVAGHIYKQGVESEVSEEDDKQSNSTVPINLHCDEFNELMGDEFIPLINKGGGAGIQVTAYTQTLSDIEARIGSTPKAGQVVGNFNHVVMLRVREDKTAELLTNQLSQVDVQTRMMVSMTTDNSSVDTDIDFTSSGGDRISTTQVPMLTPNDVVSLPKGQAFALMEGGKLWKLRMPLPIAESGEHVPKNIKDLSVRMKRRYSMTQSSDQWWMTSGTPPTAVMTTIAEEAISVSKINDSSTVSLEKTESDVVQKDSDTRPLSTLHDNPTSMTGVVVNETSDHHLLDALARDEADLVIECPTDKNEVEGSDELR